MMRLAFVPAVIISVLAVAGCSKKESAASEAAVLYGTWVKGPNFGDTLRFMRKDNRNIMLIAESFNAGMPVYAEKPYSFHNGKLKIKTFASVSEDYYNIDSFTWIQPGSGFIVQGIQLFLFMSSTNTYFTYRKI